MLAVAVAAAVAAAVAVAVAALAGGMRCLWNPFQHIKWRIIFMHFVFFSYYLYTLVSTYSLRKNSANSQEV